MKLYRPSFWETNNLISTLLTPLSWLYILITKIRIFFGKGYVSSIKTICVGNATVGGAGKTPFVISLVKLAKKQNIKICIITRGYKGKIKGPIFLDPTIHNYHETGDEAQILIKYAPTIISKNKLKAVKLAEQNGYEVAIFDDGLQNPSINYTIRYLVYNEQNAGNKKIIPAGPLRESLNYAFNKADLIFTNIDDQNQISLKNYKNKIRLIKPQPTLRFAHLDQKIILFTGIANPLKFFYFMKSISANIVATLSFPDHHLYNNKELDEIISKANNIKAKIFTTEKDYVKIPSKYHNLISFVPYEYKINLDSLII